VTSCVLRRIIRSEVSTVFRQFLTFTTIWGICASLERNPNGLTRLSWSQLLHS
jgi:hypothetical protein